MKKLGVIAMILFGSTLAFAASYTASVTGNVNSSTTFGGSGTPNCSGGDTITVNSGVTLAMNISCSTTITSSGNVTVATGTTTTLQGGSSITGHTWTQQAGSGLALSTYSLAFSSSSYFAANGTSGSHVTVSGSGGYLSSGNSDGLNVNAIYTDFTGVGSSGQDALAFSPSSLNYTQTLNHCTFDSTSGRVNDTASFAGANGYSYTNNVFNQSSTPLRIAIGGALSGGTWVLTGNVFINQPILYIDDATITGNLFEQGWNAYSASTAWSTFSDNFVRETAPGGSEVNGMQVYGNVTDSYFMADNQNGNPHIVLPQLNGTIDGIIIEYTGPYVEDGGDGIYFDSSLTLTVEYSIVLPSPADGQPSSNLVNAPSGAAVSTYHNTFTFAGEGGLAIGDLSSGAGTYANFKNNLGWAPNGASCPAYDCELVYSKTHSGNPLLDAQNALTPANATNNYTWNAAIGYSRATQFPGVSGYGYQTNTSAAPGTNDIDQSGGTGPNFVNSSVNFGGWAVTQGSTAGTYAGKVSDGLGYLAANPGLIISSLIPYIRSGFAPQNSALHNAASDGTDIGAVAYQAPPSHPYIWLTPTVLSSIDAKAAASDPNWVSLKAQADTYLTYTVPAFDRNACTSTEICYTYEGGGWYNAITTLGLAYQVTGNTAYANQVIAIMQAATATYTNVGTLTVNASNDLEVTASNWTFTSNDQYIYISGGTGWTPGWYSVSSISGSSAILATSPAAVGTTGGVWHDVQPISVDQGYPSRYAALGLAIGFDWVYSQLTSQEKTDTINTLNLWYDWYKLYAYEESGPATGNYFTGHLLGFGAAGYATAGDNSRSSEIEAYIENLFTTVVDPSISSGELQGGYPIESYNYGPNNFERTLQYMQIVKDNSSTDLGIVAFGEKMANSLIYNLKPNLWEASDEGDYPGTYTGVMPSNLPLIVAYETSGTTQGAWMQYMGNNFATPPDGGISIQTALPLEYLLYANSSRTATSYSGQPTFYASPGDAHFYGLSGWASTSIWSSFAGGSTVWGDHQMHGAGHIAIQRGSDYLLVNNGQWKGTDGISGSPTIDDSVNSWRTNTLYFNDGSSLTDGDQYVGGQGYWGTTDLFASGIGTNYLYAKSNLVSAYPNGPNYPYNGNSTLLTFIRSYVFLGDHYWVVWDRATDALSTYTMNLFWHFNLNGEPTISGNTLTSTTGSSVLYVTTLLPSGASISVAGDGVASFTDSTISTYRGIIANSVSGTTLNVLTVMDADAAATSEPAVSSITVGSGNMVGAQIADATPRAVLFSSDGTAQTSVTYSTTYSGTGRNVVADLSPGTYKAVVNGSTVASGLSVASGNGTLTFTSGSGTVLISQQVNAGTQLSGVASGVIQ